MRKKIQKVITLHSILLWETFYKIGLEKVSCHKTDTMRLFSTAAQTSLAFEAWKRELKIYIFSYCLAVWKLQLHRDHAF